jgi:UDP-N-acetyl-D-mannosaminuronic acid dehydrogenase
MGNQLMPIKAETWKIEKIGVIGPGIVGMPMAGMLANAKIRIGTDSPAKVIVVQRDSRNSGWKVDSINNGKSVIGGIEPELDDITREAVKAGLLSATSDFSKLSDADVVCLFRCKPIKKDLSQIMDLCSVLSRNWLRPLVKSLKERFH